MSSSTTNVSTYRFNHTMIRVKDKDASLRFYCDILGMEQIDTHEGGDFTLFFLAYPEPGTNLTAEQKKERRAGREAILELTYNHGSEKDSSVAYKSGNEPEHKGFGHTCISVDDLDAACKRFTDLGVNFKKRPEDGKMRNIAFILDPDGYWVEVIAHGNKA